MNAKNLHLKFGFLALIIALSVVGLYSRGLKYGIDLRGGHSLTYEIYTNEAKQRQLENNLEDLRDQFERTTSEDEKTQLRESIDRVEQQISQLDEQSDVNLAQRMIAVLKRRVDPQGLSNIEWQPQGKNRFEVRMPAASEESQQARREFLDALEKIGDKNIRRSQIARIEDAEGQQREQLIQEFAGHAPDLAETLRKLASTYDTMQAARKEGDRDAQLNLRNQWEALQEEVQSYNINRQRMESLLRNYVSPRQAEAMQNKTELKRRREMFSESLDEFLGKHPSRREEIQQVVKLYKYWSDVRQALDSPADLKRLIAKAGVLEFRIAPVLPGVPGEAYSLSEAQLQYYSSQLAEEGPEAGKKRNEEFLWFEIDSEPKQFNQMAVQEYAGKYYILLANQPQNTMLQQTGPGGWSLASARTTVDRFNTPAVGFTFDQRGAKKFGNLTLNHQDDHLAVLLDDVAYSAPVIQSTITSEGVITGNFTAAEVRELVRTLEAGSLPARLNSEPVAESSFGPSLGEVNRKQGIRAAYLGIIIVALFMLGYYLFCGAVADIALVLNIILVLGAMSWVDAVFTLPGIAGIILTIGIAVDANVLIFERLREEQQRGQSLLMALKNAYERAFSAIFDANITTLITCLILGWVGTEEVRGFAITLGLGVTFSLFTALVVTRWIFQLYMKINKNSKPLKMVSLVGIPNINWIGKRKYFWAVSAVLIVIGVGSLIGQGSNIWGIEFSSGTKAVIQFDDDALIDGELPNDGLVRNRFVAAAEKLGHEKLVATARVETVLNPQASEELIESYDENDDAAVSIAEWENRQLNPKVFELLDANGDGELTRDELDETLPPKDFQVSTTESRIRLIRATAEEAFGDSLRRRTSVDFDFVAGDQVEEMGLDVPASGMMRVRSIPTSRFRDTLQDFQDGVLMVIENVEPSMPREELHDRISEMRLQPDFSTQLGNDTQIIPLNDVGAGKSTKFAVFVRSADDVSVANQRAWQRFAENEKELLSAALARAEAMVATNFDPAIAGNSAQLAIIAVILSWVAIIAYLWLRFGSVQWGLAAVICLIHDVIIVVGLVAISGWLSNTAIGRVLGIASFKIDLAMIAAILTVIGYSVNDTIVVFDRIRENRGKLSTATPHVLNASINQTLARTLLTSITTLIVVLVMYIYGGAGIHAFSYALLVGVLFGTYSSIAVASPLLLGFRRAIAEKVPSIPDKKEE